jgi:hypothetical protein
MKQIKWRSLLETRRQEHEEIAAAIHDFDRIGYIVSGISHKNGALEVICYPPNETDSGKFQEAAV